MPEASAPAACPKPTPARPSHMLDLAPGSGLPLWLDLQSQSLVLAQPLQTLEAEPQPYPDGPIDTTDHTTPRPNAQCWLFPNAVLLTDLAVFQEHGLRHDLWLVRPGRLGGAVSRTCGHLATRPEGGYWPEVWGVIYGQALFLLQEPALELDQPAAVYWTEAQAGQKVIVPAGHGVVVINLGREPVVASTLLSVRSRREPMSIGTLGGDTCRAREREGDATLAPGQRHTWPLTSAHERPPSQAPDLGVVDGVPLYSAFVHHPERFAWLREYTPALVAVC